MEPLLQSSRIPRSLFALADLPDQYEDLVKAEINKLSPDSLTRLLRQPDAATETSHYVICTGPSPGNRSKPERNFASPYVIEACCKLTLEYKTDRMKTYYDLMHGDPTTSTAAGMVLGHRADQFLWK